MKTVTLNGEWLYRIGGGSQTSITVPFSRLPVGHSECTRSFDVASSAKRIFLKFDGVTYYAKVFLNGIELGEMLPYCEYKFEITSIVRPLGNELRVELEDIDRAFGPSEGWENFGGIIRDVSMIMCEEHYIKDVFFKTYQSNVSGSADIEVEISADASPDAAFNVTLSKNETSVCSYIQTRGETKRMTVQNVSLWSPDDPTLYSLSVELIEDGKFIVRTRADSYGAINKENSALAIESSAQIVSTDYPVINGNTNAEYLAYFGDYKSIKPNR